MSVASLELDLDVFSGPFDLLLTLVLREEIDLMELELAEVVLAYLDHLERAGELDLESATEFILLLAALLELKSRLLVAGEDEEDLLELEPEEAAEELLRRMLDARRYRGAAGHLHALLEAEEGFRYRLAPLPKHLRRTVMQGEDRTEDPQALGAAIGALLELPPPINIGHITIHRVSVAERLRHLRSLLSCPAGREGISFEKAVKDADRVTVAVTIFALLELYKRGEADWRQEECFGDISIHAGAALVAEPAISRARAETITIRRVAAGPQGDLQAGGEISPELIAIRRVEAGEDAESSVVGAAERESVIVGAAERESAAVGAAAEHESAAVGAAEPESAVVEAAAGTAARDGR